uniref:Ig-like domain-containing protein n=1 Tax=Gopherus evgoodei TaxID=1825980 RepID=A0A8C4W3L1_9SAUR
MGHSDCAGVCLTVCLLLTAEISYPKPSISLRPSRGVALGGAVTVRCQGQHQNMRFLLYKDRNPTALQYADPSGNVAEFPICNMNRRDAGSYSCSYCSKISVQADYSEPSYPVQIIVAGEGPSPALRLPAPHPDKSLGTRTDGPLRARLCPEPWAQQGDAWPGSRYRVTVGSQPGGSSLLPCTWSDTALVTKVSGACQLNIKRRGPICHRQVVLSHPLPGGGLCPQQRDLELEVGRFGALLAAGGARS